MEGKEDQDELMPPEKKLAEEIVDIRWFVAVSISVYFSATSRISEFGWKV